jgi:hypothetical protein
MRRLPSRFGRTVVLAAAVCALTVAGGCGRETFNLLPDATLDSAGQTPAGSAGSAGSDSGHANGGSSAASGKGGGGAGKAEVGGFGGRPTTYPGGGGAGYLPCLGEGGCPDEEPCSLSDPFCTNCRPYTNDCAFTDANFCDPELKRCVECRNNTQCNPGERCNPNTWRCAKACGGSKDSCGGDGHLSCDLEPGVCVACIKPQDCTNNTHCYLNACVECFENVQCQSQYCYKGHCIPQH